MHACTKGLVRFTCFFIFYKSQVTRGPRKQKSASCGSILFFLSMTLARVHIFTCTVHPFIVSTVYYYYIGIADRATTSLLVFEPVKASLDGLSTFILLFFFHSLQKFDVYITNFSATAVAFFETAAAEVRQRADRTRGSVFKSQKRWLRRQRDFFLSTLASTIWVSRALRETKKSANGMDRTFESLHISKFDAAMRVRVYRGRGQSRHCQHAWQAVW